tara:strand:- start:125 stop:409 length:285 start_codon:yes stop_codon:yes gene_type:complete
MDATRTEARQLAEEGLIEICQKGKAVDPRTFRGIVRLKLLGSKMQEGTQVALSKVKEELNGASVADNLSQERKVKATSKRSTDGDEKIAKNTKK